MTQKDVAKYYGDLSRGEKGRFTAFVSLRLATQAALCCA